MPALLRFSGAVDHAPAIVAWFAAQQGELRALGQEWFSRMRECGPDVQELLHDGLATVCVEHAPFAYVGVFEHHVNVGFFHGASLPDPGGLLVGTGKSMRHVKLKPGIEFDPVALEALLAAAYVDIVTRLSS